MKRITQQDLEQLFRLSLDLLSIIRADGTFTHVNPACSRRHPSISKITSRT